MLIIYALLLVEDDIERPKRGAVVSPDSQISGYASKTNIGRYYLGKFYVQKYFITNDKHHLKKSVIL